MNPKTTSTVSTLKNQYNQSPSTTSSTPAPTSSNSTNPVSHGTKKVGLAWAGNDNSLLKNFVTGSTGYVYTWTPTCPKGYESTGLKCAPMLWGPKQVDDFRKLRQSQGASILMGMNEVNEPGQSNMSPQQGAQLWNSEIRPFGSQGFTLVSPSVTCSSTGIQWFRDFFAGCGGNDKCGVNILNIHIYVSSTDTFISQVEQYYKEFGLPIWVSEYACQDFSGQNKQCSTDQIWNFYKTMGAWFAKTDYVYAHFPFGFLSNMQNVNQGDQLIGSNGLPNALGNLVLNP